MMQFQIPENHPAIEGHFPGEPIVPAVLILDEVLRLTRITRPNVQVFAIKRAKFSTVLRPLDLCWLSLDWRSDEVADFRCVSNEIPIASGVLQFRPRIPMQST